MSLCSSFANNVECALTLQNDFNIKIYILLLIFIMSVTAIIYHKYINPEKNYFNLWLHYVYKILPPVYVGFSPFLLLMLRHAFSIELFLIVLVGISFFALAIITGTAILFGTKTALDLFGAKNVFGGEYSDSKKYKQTYKKYEKS